MVNYLVALALGLMVDSGSVLKNSRLDFWPYVILIGFLFITLFGLMAKVTQEYGVAVVSVAVKMSLAIPVVFSLVYFQERLSILNGVGILLAFPALLLSVVNTSGSNGRVQIGFMPIVLFIGSGILDALLKYVQQVHLTEETSALFSALCFGSAFVFGAATLIGRRILKGDTLMDMRSFIGGIALGIPNYGSIYFLVRALQLPGMDGSRAFPINNMGIVILSALVSVLIFKEKITTAKRLSIFLAVTAIVLMSGV
ncbi:EamA/RhaT family transporter [Thermaurantimonas aggregans]|nr:EamA/RhaT family transporter [Thermaurantimonas aggregans]MCX8148626.1 EamA/RhaT family transporter [Thermaurantimonas aggregans]